MKYLPLLVVLTLTTGGASAQTPNPAPSITPHPAPAVAPNPAPEIAPHPAPEVAPKPAPEVAPNPAPVIAPNPAPVIAPGPDLNKGILPPVVPVTNSPSATTAGTTDPAKIAELQARFEHGSALEQQGKLTEALAVYDSIIAEAPDAKGSLLHAGKISIKLNNLLKADEYLTKLHALVPDFPEAFELLIQINQTLKRDIKVEHLIRDFRALHDSGKNSQLADHFIREIIPVTADQNLIMTEFFDYLQKPNTKWRGQIINSDGNIKRQFELFYDPDATKEIRAKDPKYASAVEFLLVEEIIQDNEIKRVDAYYQVFALPEYKKVRNTMLAITANAIKPIQQIDAPPAGQ
jgi:hypothetical protein